MRFFGEKNKEHKTGSTGTRLRGHDRGESRCASSQRAFTLIELLLYMAIFSATIIGFITVLVSVLNIQTHQAGEVEVSQQSEFLLQQVQYYVSRASLVDIPQDSPTTTLKLYLGLNANDPTYIKVQSGTVYLQQTNTGTLSPLSSSRVTVAGLTFTRRANAPGHDAVNVSFTVSYNSVSALQAFSQYLQASVARVSAATFDSDLVPSSTAGAYKIGSSGNYWSSINQSIYFSGSNVGIGVVSPGQTLEVNGGMRLNTGTGQPTCASGQRGTFWVAESGSGVKDTVQVCVKNASDTYVWAGIY